MRRRLRIPVLSWLLFGLAVLCLIPALLSFAGLGALLHPALADAFAGLAFLVSAIALAGSAAFPLVIARLVERDRPD